MTKSKTSVIQNWQVKRPFIPVGGKMTYFSNQIQISFL